MIEVCRPDLSWFDDKPRWKFLMRLKSDPIAYGVGALRGCEVRKVRLGKGLCRGFRNAQIWTRDSRRVNLLLARPTGLSTNDPWTLVTSAELCLDLAWTYGQRNQVDAHWERSLSFLPIGLSWMQQCAADSSKTLLAWASISLRKLEPCIPSQSSQQNQRLPWFSKVDLPPPLDRSVPALAS